MIKKDRVGERFISNEGYEFVIIEYNGYHDLIVEFQDKYKTRVCTEYKCCQNGSVKNPYHPLVHGIGCLGVGDFKTCTNGKTTREYSLWRSMLFRCYSGSNKYPTYANVTVCERWLCFANFLEDLPKIEGYQLWMNNPNQRIALDKDLKQVGVENKVYSLDTVCFVTQRENTREAMQRKKHTRHKKVICLETKQIFNCIKEAQEWCSIKGSICNCCKGRQKTAGGYHWQYLDDYLREQRLKSDIKNSMAA